MILRTRGKQESALMPRSKYGFKTSFKKTGTYFVGCLFASSVQSASLVDLINEVNLVHPQILASRMSVAAAASDVETAKWQFYPTPSVSVRSPLSDTSDQVKSNPVVVIGLEQPIWTGGRLNAGLDIAKAGEDDAKANLDEVRQNFSLQVVQAYVDWFVAKHKTRAITESMTAHQNLLRQNDRRIGEGLAAPSDRIQLLSRIEQIDGDMKAYRGQAQRSMALMRQLIGRELQERELTSDLAQPLTVLVDYRALQLDAIAISPQLQIAKAGIESAEAHVKQAKATWLPRVSLSLEHQLNSQYEGQNDVINRAYITVASDIGAGFSARTISASAGARLEAANNQIHAVQLQLASQIESDHISFVSLNAQKKALSAAIESSKAVCASYARQYLEGRKTWLDVMNCEREISQLRIQMVDIDGGQLSISWRLGILTKGVSGIARQATDFDASEAEKVNSSL